jgi:acetoin utilization deacetylase AcuC-like enzyme
VAILDTDYHHGNGTESIFHTRKKVLYTSIHGTPPQVYPHFTGSASSTGSGRGKGYTLNIPLEPKCGAKTYRNGLKTALTALKDFSPRYLVISAGFDIFAGDPDGDFDLPLDFSSELGNLIASLNIPALITLEGGYNITTLPELTYNFLIEFSRVRNTIS